MERVELHDDGTLHFLINLEPAFFNRVAKNPDEFAESLQSSISIGIQNPHAAHEHGHFRRRLMDDLADLAFVLRVRVGMQERHDDGVGACCFCGYDGLPHIRRVDRGLNGTVLQGPFREPIDPFTWRQRRRAL